MKHEHTNYSRRDLLKALAGAGLAAGLPMAPFMPAYAGNAANAGSAGNKDKRILVVLEMSGANDGLNTLVPYADDAYYRLRPRIGIPTPPDDCDSASGRPMNIAREFQARLEWDGFARLKMLEVKAYLPTDEINPACAPATENCTGLTCDCNS